MATNSPDQQIRSRIDAFLTELSGLVRKSALEAVHVALGEGAPVRRGRGRPRGSVKRGPGRPRKAGRPPRAAGGKRAQRTSEQVDAMAARVLAQVRSKQGQRLEEIGRAMKMPTKGLKLPIANLLAARKLKTKGRKRGMKYFAGGGRGGIVKAKRAGRKAKRGRKAAKDSTSAG